MAVFHCHTRENNYKHTSGSERLFDQEHDRNVRRTA